LRFAFARVHDACAGERVNGCEGERAVDLVIELAEDPAAHAAQAEAIAGIAGAIRGRKNVAD
jgi:hypothetical protein